MEKIQGAQSKIDIATASRKCATQNLIGLQAKKNKKKLTSQLIVFLKSCNFVEEDIDIMLHGPS